MRAATASHVGRQEGETGCHHSLGMQCQRRRRRHRFGNVAVELLRWAVRENGDRDTTYTRIFDEVFTSDRAAVHKICGDDFSSGTRFCRPAS